MTDQHIDAPAAQAGDVPLFPGGPTMAESWDEEHGQQGATEFMVGDDQGVGLGGDFGFGLADDEVDIAAVMSGLGDLGDREPAEEEREPTVDPAAEKPDGPAAAAPGSSEEPTTTIHGVPGADGPVTVSGDLALLGSEHLTFEELGQLAGMVGSSSDESDESDEVLEGKIAKAKQLLAEAEERGEGVADLAHAVTYLDGVHKAYGDRLKRTRQRAEQVYAAAQLVHGTKSVSVTLDDGGPAVCTVHIQEPEREIAWDQGAVLAHCGERYAHNLYDVVSARALEVPEVQAFVKALFPELVRTEVRPAFLKALKDRLDDDGNVVDETTGQLVKLAKVQRPVSCGQFRLSYVKAKGNQLEGKERVARAYREKRLGDDVLSLGVAPEDDADPEADENETASA